MSYELPTTTKEIQEELNGQELFTRGWLPGDLEEYSSIVGVEDGKVFHLGKEIKTTDKMWKDLYYKQLLDFSINPI